MMLLALRAALFAALRTRSAAGSVRAPCSTWYDNTTHGSSFRSVVSFGATGDGKIDDTAAIQAAINFGVGSVQQKLPLPSCISRLAGTWYQTLWSCITTLT
jgi:polygalacturonase